VRLLRAQGIRPAVWHANEGHSAFMMLERVREQLAKGRDFDAAVADVRASTAFTTHTPVPAGHDAFPLPLVEKYLEPYWSKLGPDRDRFVALGRHEETWGSAFNMTALALRLSGHCNAVSARHAEVSRRMWAPLWGGDEGAVPIVPVTNGVHVLSWVAPEFIRAYRAQAGDDWMAHLDSPAAWQRAVSMPDVEFWTLHRRLKLKMLGFMRARARSRWEQDGVASAQVVAGGTLFEPDVLTIGFARRFATYKRAFLPFSDPDRLKALLTDPQRPVQMVFAGKAHPADEPGKRILQTVYQAATDPAFAGRIAFIDDYDINVAQHVVQGVDVWLNTPRPPLEASGTSGEKAALNGVPSLSTLDGWWAEAYDGTNGWAIPEPGERSTDVDAEDARDAEALYRILESEVVPLYYERSSSGLPAKWINLMRRTIETVAPVFNARRMVKEYVARLYAPAWASSPDGHADEPGPDGSAVSDHFHDDLAVLTGPTVGRMRG
jgi:starch phosphorylase